MKTTTHDLAQELLSKEDNFITVTIPFSENQKIKNVEYSGLSTTQRKILELIKDDNELTVSEMVAILNLGQTTINNALKKLKSLGYIQRIGSNKNGTWKVL